VHLDLVPGGGALAGVFPADGPRLVEPLVGKERMGHETLLRRWSDGTLTRPRQRSGLNQSRSSAATAPTTIVEGAGTSCTPIVASVARVTCCSDRVPQWMAATGVSVGRPPATRRSAITLARAAPMSTTMVPPTRAIASQSTAMPDDGSSWPVTTVNDSAVCRIVTGMPAYAGTAIA